MLQLQRVLGTQYTSTAQQAVMQAKKVLDGSKHEYSTLHCTEARTRTGHLQLLHCVYLSIHTMQFTPQMNKLV